MIPRPSRITLFPYTTLFRSEYGGVLGRCEVGGEVGRLPGKIKREFAFHRPPPGYCLRPVTCSRRGGRVVYGSSLDRKSTRLNSSHVEISYAVFCLKKKNTACRVVCPACRSAALPARSLRPARPARRSSSRFQPSLRCSWPSASPKRTSLRTFFPVL